MSGRGQAPLALAFVAAVALALVGADRIGTAAPEAAPAPTLASARWICPHGGGEGWVGSIVVMNPGTDSVDVRISTVGRSRKVVTDEATVPASRQLVHEVPVDDRGAATIVDAFGPPVGVAWLVTSEDPGGLGAEPCLAAGARRWFAGDPGTPQGDDAFLVITNPYEIDAIVDVALFTKSRAPIRPKDWTDLEIRAMQSVSLPVNDAAEGEDAVVAQVTAEVGRVGVASLVVGKEGGIRSAVATPSSSAPVDHLPVAGGAGSTSLVIGVPAGPEAHFAATLLTSAPPQPAGGLTDGEQAAASAHVYEVPTAGEPSSVSVSAEEGAALVASLRAEGRSPDDGATAGTSETARDWVVPTTYLSTRSEPAFPALVLVNPGSRDASVTLRHLPGEDGVSGKAATIAVPARSAIRAPAAFLAAAPRAAVAVHADGGEIVALGATASRGVEGYARFALVLGVPIALAY